MTRRRRRRPLVKATGIVAGLTCLYLATTSTLVWHRFGGNVSTEAKLGHLEEWSIEAELDRQALLLPHESPPPPPPKVLLEDSRNKYALFVLGLQESGHARMASRLAAAAGVRVIDERFSSLSSTVAVVRIDDFGLLSTALQRASRNTRVVAVLRHPLPRALRVAQTMSTTNNATIRNEIERWMRMAEVYVQTPNVSIVHAEAFDGSVTRALLERESAVVLARDEGPVVQNNVLLVRCWLRGVHFSDFVRVCERGESILLQDQMERAADRHLEFWFVKRLYECDMERFGYSLRSFESLLACGRSCGNAVRDARKEPPYIKEFLAKEVADKLVSRLAASAAKEKKGDVIVAFFKLYNNAKSSGAKGGMFARMAQVVNALDEAGYRVHFVCHCIMGPLRQVDRDWAPKDTRFYEGDTNQQLDQLLPYSCGGSSIRALFLFVTSLTVDMHFRAAVKKAKFWWKEPRLGSIASEQIARRVSHHSPSVKRVVLTDDIHSIRARQAFSDVKEPVHIDFMLAWLKRREFGIYEAADYVLTVSSEDATVIGRELELSRPDSDSKRFRRRPPAIVWAPFVQTTAGATAAKPGNLANRSGLLYIGMPHPVAVPSVKWLVRLLPRLRAHLREHHGLPEAEVVKQATLFLGGGGEQSKRWRNAVKHLPGANETVKLVGQISDATFEKHMTLWRRVLAAPLFNNTGVATKIINGLSYGIPIVTTSGGCRGLGLPENNFSHILRVSDDVEGYVRETAKLLTDDLLWMRLARNGQKHVEETLSTSALRKIVSDAVTDGGDNVENAELEKSTRYRHLPNSKRLLEESTDVPLALGVGDDPPSLVNFQGAWYNARRDGNFLIVDRVVSFGNGSALETVRNVSTTALGKVCAKKQKWAKNPGPLPVDEVKLFEWRASLWAMYVGPPRCGGGKTKCGLCDLEAVHYLANVFGNARPKAVVVKGAPLGINQRGFVPWVLREDLYISATIEPHVVLKCDEIGANSSLATARLVAVSSSDDLWRDLRALDGGCLVRPVVFPTSPAVSFEGRFFVGVARTHLQIGCVRFHEHLAYRFEPAFPFKVTHRSYTLPLESKSFAPVASTGGDECRPADSYRVRSGKARAASGITVVEGNLHISYSTTTLARVFAIPPAKLFDAGDFRLTPADCPSEPPAPPECRVLQEYTCPPS